MLTASAPLQQSDFEDFIKPFRFTTREREIFFELLGGKTSFKVLAESLGLSVNTVQNHLKNIYEKAGASSKSEMLASALVFVCKKHASAKTLLRPINALAVDDEDDILDILKDGLIERGLNIHTINNATKALEYIDSHQIDVVISDNCPVRAGVTEIGS